MRGGETGERWRGVEERAAFLGGVRLFGGLPPEVLRAVAEQFRVRRVARGDFVFLEAAPASSLNVLAEGRVKVIRETEEGREVILRQIDPGEIFGGAGGWGAATYPASARAQTDAVVLQLPAEMFTALMRTQPDVALAVVGELGSRLREAEARIRDLQSARVERRLAHALLRLAGKAGAEEVALTRQDLAEMAGTTLSTASRTLSGWDQQGILEARRERVRIVKPRALEAIAADLPPPAEDQGSHAEADGAHDRGRAV